MEELKPCPFCGRKPDMRHTLDGFSYVLCANDGCYARTDGCLNEEEATKVWNRRAEPGNKPQELCSEDENFIQTKFGYCFYTLDSNPLIYNLYVRPQYRRCGHSNTLLRLAIGRIRGNGYKGDIRIQTEPRENSIGLEDLTKYYKSMGLIVEARNPKGE
jgi:GNAT superfamily N-acetyltransferase